METLGQYLKKERLLRDIKLADVCAATRIPLKSLQNLEEDLWAKMPSAVFVRGFLKSYCQFLGLNIHDVLQRYDREQLSQSAKTENIKETSRTRKNYPLYVWAVILSIAAVTFYFFISLRKDHIQVSNKIRSPLEAFELDIPMGQTWFPEQGTRYFLSAYDSVWIKIQVDEYSVVSFP